MPLFQFAAPPPRPYYRSPLTGTLAELIGRQGQINADYATRQGQIAAHTAESIGDTVTGTLRDLTRFAMNAPQRELTAARVANEKLELEKRRNALQEETLIKQAMSDAGGDPETALDALRSQGGIGVNAASKLQQQVKDARMADLKDQHDKYTMASQKLTTAGQFLRGLDELPDEQRADGYARILPKVRELVGPDLSQYLPETYDPTTVHQALTWGETASQTIQRRTEALATARDGIAKAKDAREADGYHTKALGQWLSTVTSQEEWDQALHESKQLGAADGTLAKFGTQYSPEAVKRALTFAETPGERARAEKGPTPGTFEDYLTSYARDVAKKPLETLSAKDKESAARRWAGAHKTDTASEITPEKRAQLVQTVMQYPVIWNDLTPGQKGAIAADLGTAGFTHFGESTQAQKAAVERWRTTELGKVQSDLGYGVIDDTQATARRAEIDASARVQLGGGAPGAAPAKPTTPATGGPQIGQVVTVRGKRIKITKLFPDGTFDGTEVK